MTEPAIGIPSSRKAHHPKKKDLTDSDMAAAEKQLMQLSDEENNNSNNNYNVDMADEDEEEEVTDQRLTKKNNTTIDVNVNVMEEIFGKEVDHGVICRAKKRRYRSLADIYMETKKMIRSS